MGEGLAADMSGTGCWSLAETTVDALMGKRAIRTATVHYTPDGGVEVEVEDTSGDRFTMTVQEGD